MPRHQAPNSRRVSGSRRAEGDERVRCTRVLDGGCTIYPILEAAVSKQYVPCNEQELPTVGMRQGLSARKHSSPTRLGPRRIRRLEKLELVV